MSKISKKSLGKSEQIGGGLEKPPLPKYLGYALPRAWQDNTSIVHEYADLNLHDVPLSSSVSFLDFSGIALFGGAFEKVDDSDIVCAATSDLDLRERELYTCLQDNKPVVFMVPKLPAADHRVDLLRRVLVGFDIGWEHLGSPVAYIHSDVPEFEEFVKRYGSAYIRYGYGGKATRVICRTKESILGFSIFDKLFILPCAYPTTHQQAVDMTVEAIRAARDYRDRVKEDFPEWVAEYRFGKESELISKAEGLQGQLVRLKSTLDVYKKYKGALCFRSAPLVRVVTDVLHDFFGIDLECDEKCVEEPF